MTGREWLWSDLSYYPSILFTETEKYLEGLLLSECIAKHSFHLKLTRIYEKCRLTVSKNHVPNKVLESKRE
jgi:hypothetical protein